MRMVTTVMTILVQFTAAYILGFITALFLSIGNGWELAVFAVGGTLGVWSAGILSARVGWIKAGAPYVPRLISTLVGSLLGVLVILITPPMGFGAVVFPFIGALLGYYALELVQRSRSV